MPNPMAMRGLSWSFAVATLSHAIVAAVDLRMAGCTISSDGVALTSNCPFHDAETTPPPVAFFADAWQAEQLVPPNEQTVVSFRPARVDYGGGWRHEANAYAVPTSGVYALNTACGVFEPGSSSTRYVKLSVVVDGQHMGCAPAAARSRPPSTLAPLQADRRPTSRYPLLERAQRHLRGCPC